MPVAPAPSHVLVVTGARTWHDVAAMRAAFQELWRAWGPGIVTRPLLISGHATRGADARAEELWRAGGFEVEQLPADWERHGRRAGFVRNAEMIALAQWYRDRGSVVHCLAFLDRCTQANCTQSGNEQLLPAQAGHFSHGALHTRGLALAAGIPTTDIIQTRR